MEAGRTLGDDGCDGAEVDGEPWKNFFTSNFLFGGTLLGALADDAAGGMDAAVWTDDWPLT